MGTILRASTEAVATRLQSRTTIAGEDGQALIEYALILGLVVTIAVVSLEALGGGVYSLMSTVQAAVP